MTIILPALPFTALPRQRAFLTNRPRACRLVPSATLQAIAAARRNLTERGRLAAPGRVVDCCDERGTNLGSLLSFLTILVVLAICALGSGVVHRPRP